MLAVRYFPIGNFPSGNFKRVSSQVETNQMFNFQSVLAEEPSPHRFNYAYFVRCSTMSFKVIELVRFSDFVRVQTKQKL